jgi:hypothetical protein
VRDEQHEEIKRMLEEDLRQFRDAQGLRARMLKYAMTGGRATQRRQRERMWTLAAAGLAVVVVAALLLGLRAVRPPAGASLAPGTEYTIVAPLLAKPGSPIYACYGELLPFPPADTCPGIEVRNVDVTTITALGGKSTLPGGTHESRSVRLQGTWNGQALTLTKRPIPANYPPTPLPSPLVGVPPPSGEAAALAEARRIAGDSSLRQEGVQVMSVGVGFHGKDVDVLLAVADAHAAQVLQRHYDSVYVTGWLQPVTHGSGR